ncbi:chaplin, partial [Streptomyces sp. NPDC001759]
MRQTLSKGMVAAAAATSILSLYASPALAGSQAGAAAKSSPGVLSGNNVEVPVEVPVNACGNSVNAVAGLDPAFGNRCANDSGSHTYRLHQSSHEDYGDEDSGYGDTGYGDTGYGDHGGGHGDPTQPPGHVDNTPPPGHVDHTSPPDGGHDSPSPKGGGDHTPPPYGETTPPPKD